MRASRFIILGVLLLAVGGLIYILIRPARQEGPGAPAQVPPRVITPEMLSHAPRLPDGSYNPLPAARALPGDDIATHSARLAWRERYRPLLAATRPPTSAPLICVYPCLDLTSEGVGLHFTYGWRLTASAALAQWTDARLAAGLEPAHSGLPELQNGQPAVPPDAMGWGRLALDDPATAGARYVVTGVYSQDQQKKTWDLRTWLIDREKPEAASVLVTASNSQSWDFVRLAADQRSVARATADALIKQGLVNPRSTPPAGGLNLDAELTSVTQMLELGDSWAVMDAIDRSLALATLFPDETAPLQAAAYGLMQLHWTFGAYATYVTYGKLDALKAWALCQVAMAIDNKPQMTQLIWANACGAAGHSAKARMIDAMGGIMPADNVELDHYRSLALEQPIDSRLAQAALPQWVGLWLDRQQQWNARQSLMSDFYAERAKNWAACDLYLMALLHGYDQYYNLGELGGPDAKLIGSRYACQGTLAGELAAILTALGGGGEAESLIKLINLKDETAAERLSDLARVRDYYSLRRELLGAFAAWQEPAEETHPAYGLLAGLDGRAQAIGKDPQFMKPLSVYQAFEFTPAERVRFANHRDHIGPFMLAEHVAQSGGGYEKAVAIAQAYLKRRPANAAAQFNLQLIAEPYPQSPANDALSTATAQAAYAGFPLEPAPLCRLGQVLLGQGQRERAAACLIAFNRSDPANLFRNLRIGEIFCQFGYFSEAADNYYAFLKEAPARYDVANKRAWALCQIGRWNEPGVRQAFEESIRRVPDNAQFREDHLNFLFHWAGDLATARVAAADYGRVAPGRAEPLIWGAAVEHADGKTSKALELLGQARGEGLSGPELVDFHVRLAQAYLEYGQPGQAAPHVQAAAKADASQPAVINAQGDLAFAQGDYAKAQAEFQRVLEGQGFNPALVLKVAKCMDRQGQKENAAKLLEEHIYTQKREDPRLCLQLLTCDVELKRSDRIMELLQMIVKSPQRSRQLILSAADAIKPANEQLAGQIRQNIDQIMTGK